METENRYAMRTCSRGLDYARLSWASQAFFGPSTESSAALVRGGIVGIGASPLLSVQIQFRKNNDQVAWKVTEEVKSVASDLGSDVVHFGG
jgi:hypothetical protein